MASPKLRLLLLASLRGLLKPDYAFGISSVVREVIICNALSREIEGDSKINRAAIEIATMGFVDPRQRSAVFRTANDMREQGKYLKQMHNSMSMMQMGNVNPGQNDDVKKMITTLKVLKHTDFSERMAKILEDDAKQTRR